MGRQRQRRKTDWFCTKCRRPLHNSPEVRRKDTVKASTGMRMVRYVHDGCGGQVVA